MTHLVNLGGGRVTWQSLIGNKRLPVNFRKRNGRRRSFTLRKGKVHDLISITITQVSTRLSQFIQMCIFYSSVLEDINTSHFNHHVRENVYSSLIYLIVKNVNRKLTIFVTEFTWIKNTSSTHKYVLIEGNKQTRVVTPKLYFGKLMSMPFLLFGST